ncbi:hypothetical protein MRY82_06095 [bacterium]|nr:hypothetical protein [bacterium]
MKLKVICFVLLSASTLFSKPLGGISIHLDPCVDDLDGYALHDSLMPKMGNIFHVHPNSKNLVILVDVHAHRDLKKGDSKHIVFETESNDNVSIPYKISGDHTTVVDEYQNMTSMCKLEIILKKGGESDKVQFNLEGSSFALFEEMGEISGVQQRLYERLYQDSLEICTVGFYSNVLGQDFKSYVELIEFLKNLVRQELKTEHPDWTPQQIEDKLYEMFEGFTVDDVDEFLS